MEYIEIFMIVIKRLVFKYSLLLVVLKVYIILEFNINKN